MKYQTRLLAAALTLSVGLSFAGCLRLGFDRELMLGTIADTVILPAHLELTEQAERLDVAARGFVDAPSTLSLEDVRARWLELAVAWKRVELYEFPGLLLIHNAIERRPARIAFIEQAITEADPEELDRIDAEYVESLGSTSKGLGGIEYLIFGPGDAHAVLESFADPARGAYLTALTSNLERKTQELHSFWTPEGANYAQVFRENDSEGADTQGSVSLLANQMIALHEIVMRRRLGMPMGQTTDGVPQPEEVEAPLSGSSLQLMMASVQAIQRTFEAGVDDYLDYLERRPEGVPLSQATKEQFGVVLSALEALQGPLRTAVSDDPVAVEGVFEAMRPLLVFLKTDMAALLGITVTFSDSDGD